MGLSKQVLLAAAALGVAVPAAQAQVDDGLAVQGAQAHGIPKPWKSVRGFGRVLDLSKPPVIIDEPGLYAIQRDWLFPRATTDLVPELIQITADDVTLDLHGFTVSTESSSPPPSTLFEISGDRAEIRNGAIEASGVNAAFAVSGTDAWLHHLSVDSDQRGITFEGDRATISDSEILGGIHLAGESNLERNTLRSTGGASTVVLTGDRDRVMDNRILPSRAREGVLILGNSNVVANNFMLLREEAVDTGIGVDGDYNVVRGNSVLGQGGGRILRVAGTGNTLDGNLAPPLAPDQAGTPATVGMEFTADGNFYGNNRMAAQVPFALGGTVQTNWGGNVGY